LKKVGKVDLCGVEFVIETTLVLMSIYQIIKSLEETSLRTEKEQILCAHRENETLQRFFFLCLDPFTTFGIKKVPAAQATQSHFYLEDAMEALGKLSSRQLTGHAAIDYLSKLLGSVNSEDRDVLTRIMKRKPGCGVSDSTVNIIWPKLVPVYPCLLASPFTEKLVKNYDWNNAHVGCKYDAKRANVIIRDGAVRVFSRSGQEMNVLGAFDSIVSEGTEGLVIDGELMSVNKEGKPLSRSLSNGICNKATKNTLSQEEADSLVLVAWDIIPYDDFLDGRCDIPLKTRLVSLGAIVEHLGNKGVNKILEAEGKPVKSLAEVYAYYQEMIERGEEGCMLKDLNDPWEDIRSKKIIKFKEEKTAEFRITGWIEGKDALEGNLGSLNCESEDGIVKFDCSGFPLELRSQIYANLTSQLVKYKVTTLNNVEWITVYPEKEGIGISSIIEVTYNRKEQDRNGNWSIFLPRFKTHRDDKKVANYFGEIE
jgi:DNA ligase-1